MSKAQQEALRIWEGVPMKDWKSEVARLPEVKVISGVTWPYQSTVQGMLTRAWLLWKRSTNVIYLGMGAHNKCVGVASSVQGPGDE